MEIKSSERDFFELAFSTRSRILEAVDSPNSFVVLTVMTPFILMHPLMTALPTPALLGTLSPVSALVLRLVEPSVTTPSIGIFSPGITTISVPIVTSSGSFLLISPFSFTFA